MFLDEPPYDDAVRALYDDDLDSDGYVNNLTRLWGWRPDVQASTAEARAVITRASALTEEDLAVLVVATASARGDAYCALAWGRRLAGLTAPETAAAVLRDETDTTPPRVAALAAWARKVVIDPNATSYADVEQLRAVGLGDREIFEATAFVAARLAFATVNDALGAQPDRQLLDAAPTEVSDAVTFGRTPSAEASR